MLEAIQAAYLHALDDHAPSPQDSGCAKIDPEIAEVEPNGPHAPRFSPEGSVTVFIRGLGFRGRMIDRSAPPPRAPTEAEVLSRERGRFQSLAFMFGFPAPVLTVVTQTADLTMTGADATAALTAVDRVLANPMVPIAVSEGEKQTQALPRAALEEIQRVARRSKRR
jgi:hypothetical protein